MRLSDEKLFAAMQSVWSHGRACCEGCRARSYQQTCELVHTLTGLPTKEIYDRCLDLDDESDRHQGPYPNVSTSTLFERVH